MGEAKRLYYLDALRAFIILIIIVMHVTWPYVIPMNIILKIPDRMDAFIGAVFAVFDGPFGNMFMACMFFIAGYFVWPSLKKHGVRPFIKNKLIRLGIPYLFGLTVLAPLLGYMAYASRGGRTGYWEYWLSRFYRPEYFSPYHVWFLGVLLFFFLVTAAVYPALRNADSSGEKLKPKPSPWFLGLFIAVLTGVTFFLNLFFSIHGSWVTLWAVQFQIVRLPVYAAYFILGIVFYQNGWLQNGYSPKLIRWIATYVLGLPIHIYFSLLLFQGESGTPLEKLAMSLVFNIITLAALFWLLGLFRKCFNRETPFMKAVTDSSFSVYLVQFNIVFGVLYLTGNISIAPDIKFIGQIIVSAFISWGFGYVMKRTPVLNKIV